MPINPHHRKEISLEKLNTLRENVREAYSLSKGEILQTPKSKNSIYYSELKVDISLKTKKDISEGTLLKFFCDDLNRKYQVITISAIEEYIEKVFLENSTFIDNAEPTENTDKEIKKFANNIYIELITRKAGIPLEEDKDVIEEIYNSWYKLFCIIRDEIKSLPAKYLKDLSNPESAQGISMKILNDILRPHLTEHQAKFRNWLAKAKQDPQYSNLTPQELQKKYPDYEILFKSLKKTNEMLIESAERLQY